MLLVHQFIALHTDFLGISSPIPFIYVCSLGFRILKICRTSGLDAMNEFFVHTTTPCLMLLWFLEKVMLTKNYIEQV